jgi:glycosyltransferase involved in cell wall biosynthesis
MIVAQVHTAYRQAGGEDAVAAAEASLLEAAGHRVQRLRFSNPATPLAAAAALAAVPWNRSAAARVSANIEGIPDVIHIHNTWFALGPAAVTALHRQAPVVMTLHNYRSACANALLFRDGHPCLDCVGNFGLPGIRHRCYRGSAAASTVVALTNTGFRRRVWPQAVDRVLAHNPLAARVFADSGIPSGLVEMVDNFVPDPGERGGPPSRSDEVLAVGRLSPEKGFDRIMAAWNASGSHLRLQVIGDGPQAPRLRELTGRRVEMVGTLPPDQVAEKMKTARALVFPSLWFESQPMVLLEALAAGLPAFAADHEPLRWILGELGEEGLIGPNSWGDLPRLLEDDALVDSRGSASRDLYMRRFSAQTALTVRQRVYAAAVDHHRRHG